MKCIRCESTMGKQSGMYGDFMFCPNQKICGQKTVSCEDVVFAEALRSSNNPLVLEMRVMQAELGPLFSDGGNCGDFVNGVGEAVDYDGELIGNSGDWFRPY